ncbi:LrgB family protein [Dolosicoccus paucivorans]|uniref:LrgB family protein n=1 Tax=Dolosicoccus paucivorans TaxID=84521 RepID=UPI000884836A|nr:LrgB family protein [Dolosicoccus paucivorans]SDI36000.1 Putative effector of murein hydrolase [Dolosicoccus paucivorans]
MINALLLSPFFWIVLTLATFLLVVQLQSRIPIEIVRSFFNPLLISAILIIILLLVLDVPYEQYQSGGQYIGLFVTPATVALGIKLEKNFVYLKSYYPAILTGIIVGVLFHTLMVFGFALLFNWTPEMFATLYPKSITTAIAIGVAESTGGIVPLTVAIVVFTGVIGATIGDTILKAFKITDPVAQGIALGTSAHAVGTSKAIQMGEIQGSMAGLSIIVTGLAVVLLAPAVPFLVQFLM